MQAFFCVLRHSYQLLFAVDLFHSSIIFNYCVYVCFLRFRRWNP